MATINFASPSMWLLIEGGYYSFRKRAMIAAVAHVFRMYVRM